MSIPFSFSRLLADRGISMMETFHTADVGLVCADALAAAETLSGAGVAILGGDVFYKTENGLELAYASWHSEPKPGEDAVAYAARSIREACEYIQSYPVVRNKKAIFALVVAEVH